MINLGLRVLFISPRFFGYEKEIQIELKAAGCLVDWYDDRPSTTPLMKAAIRFRPELVARITANYFREIICDTKTKNYDVVFVLKGEALTPSMIRSLREQHPRAKFFYYSWDSLKNFKNSKEKLSCFDRAYSFDRMDCENNQEIKHLPLFYIRAYENLGNANQTAAQTDIDLLFLGSIHSDRYTVTRRICGAALQLAPNLSVYAHFFYQSKWVFLVRKLLDSQFRKIRWKDVKWHSLDTQKTLDLIRRSKILIDIHHPGQSGLSMRTIECLGAGKKIITTNQDVVNYDFYCPDNILVVSRIAPKISTAFIAEPFRPVEEEIYRKYSLRAWLEEIFLEKETSFAS